MYINRALTLAEPDVINFTLTRTLEELRLGAIWLSESFFSIFNCPISSTQNGYTHQKDCTNLYSIQIALKF